MKQIAFAALFVLVVSGIALSQPEEVPQHGNEKEEAHKVQPPETAKEATQAQKAKEWPPPFAPTEEVGADAVISFPTDI